MRLDVQVLDSNDVRVLDSGLMLEGLGLRGILLSGHGLVSLFRSHVRLNAFPELGRRDPHVLRSQ